MDRWRMHASMRTCVPAVQGSRVQGAMHSGLLLLRSVTRHMQRSVNRHMQKLCGVGRALGIDTNPGQELAGKTSPLQWACIVVAEPTVTDMCGQPPHATKQYIHLFPHASSKTLAGRNPSSRQWVLAAGGSQRVVTTCAEGGIHSCLVCICMHFLY